VSPFLLISVLSYDILPGVTTILDRIEATALNGDVIRALRLCLSLGGHTDSPELRDWAMRELHGYDGVPNLPDYRRIRGPLCADTITATSQVRGQRISPHQLPDFAQEHISEEIEIRDSVPALQNMADSAERTNETIRVSPHGAAEIVNYMSTQLPGTRVMRLYWNLNASAIRAITERVCTDVIAMVNEIKAGIEPGQEFPSRDLVTQAIDVVINGNHSRVIVKDVTQSQNSPPIEDGSGSSRLRKLWWVVGIIGTLGALVFGFMEMAT